MNISKFVYVDYDKCIRVFMKSGRGCWDNLVISDLVVIFLYDLNFLKLLVVDC